MSSVENTQHSTVCYHLQLNKPHPLQYAITSSLISHTHSHMQILPLFLLGKFTGYNTHHMPINYNIYQQMYIIIQMLTKKNHVAFFLTEKQNINISNLFNFMDSFPHLMYWK